MKIALNKETKLEELIEALKPFAVEVDGVVALDTDELKTKTDVETVLGSKRHVDEELTKVKKSHADAQEKLKAYHEAFGDDIESVKEEIETLRSKGGENSDEMLNLKKTLRTLTKERDSFKSQYESQASRIADLDRRELLDRKNSKFETEVLAKLDPKYDKAKARTIWGDVRDRVKFREDDPGEFDEFEQGKTVQQALTERLDLYGAYVPAQGGKSNPGSANPQGGADKGGGMFASAAAQIQL